MKSNKKLSLDRFKKIVSNADIRNNTTLKGNEMKIQLAQSTILNTDLRVIDIHSRQVVVRWSTQKVIGFADNGGFSQDPLRVRYFQNLLDMYNIDGVWHA